MNKCGKQFLLILLGVAMTGGAACTTTTTQRAGPSQAAMSQHGISEGDAVLVRYTNADDANSSSRSERLQITGISAAGLSGLTEEGHATSARWGEVFQVERTRSDVGGPKYRPLPGQVVKAAKSTGRALGALIYVYANAMGGG